MHNDLSKVQLDLPELTPRQKWVLVRLFGVLADIAEKHADAVLKSSPPQQAHTNQRVHGIEHGNVSVVATGGGPELLRVADIAATLRLGRSQVYAMCARGELPVIRIGRSVRIPRQALREWIRERTERPE
jgi:excisionase family DNA binding protein